MWGDELAWLVVFARAILPKDWHDLAGEVFRTVMQAIREFAEKKRLLPKDLIQRGLEDGFQKAKVHLSHEQAGTEGKVQAVEASARSEAKEIEGMLEKRRQEDIFPEGYEERRIAAEADRAEIEAARAELKFLDDLNRLGMAELLSRPEGVALRRLLKRLDGAGVLPYWDGRNNILMVLPRPEDSCGLLLPDSKPEDPSSTIP